MTVSEFTKLSEQDYLCLVKDLDDGEIYWVVFKPSDFEISCRHYLEIGSAEPLCRPYTAYNKLQK